MSNGIKILYTAETFQLMARGDEDRPYPRATSGNIDVTLSVGRTTLERRAA